MNYDEIVQIIKQIQTDINAAESVYNQMNPKDALLLDSQAYYIKSLELKLQHYISKAKELKPAFTELKVTTGVNLIQY